MRGKWWMAAGATGLLLIAGAAWAGRDVYAFARLGTIYAAKQTCSCLFVSGRELASCKTDYPAGNVSQFTWTVTDNDVAVSVAAGLISAKATFEDGYGCSPAT